MVLICIQHICCIIQLVDIDICIYGYYIRKRTYIWMLNTGERMCGRMSVQHTVKHICYSYVSIYNNTLTGILF